MGEEWNEARLKKYIADQIEESQTLEYKAADSLGRQNNFRDEITKDVSAMANAAGGVLVYGIAEYKDSNRRHLPEKLDPIDRQNFSREWLAQVIANIQPRIADLKIYPVALSSDITHVAYVIDIPQGKTAHQATSLKYYRRYNFEAVAMKDYEIRDVMNRLTVPDVAVEFSYQRVTIEDDEHRCKLSVIVKNLGAQVVNHFQLQFTFPTHNDNVQEVIHSAHVNFWRSSQDLYTIRYSSNMVLFPEEEREIGQELNVRYRVDHDIYTRIIHGSNPLTVEWRLHADNMPMKTGSIPFEKLQCF